MKRISKLIAVLGISLFICGCGGASSSSSNNSFDSINPQEALNYSDTPGITVSQSNALKKAKQLLNYTSFSYDTLVRQLEFEKFSTADAVWAVDNCGADWNEQAYLTGQRCLDYISYSHDGLIDRLEYELFTTEQALYAADLLFGVADLGTEIYDEIPSRNRVENLPDSDGNVLLNNNHSDNIIVITPYNDRDDISYEYPANTDDNYTSSNEDSKSNNEIVDIPQNDNEIINNTTDGKTDSTSSEGNNLELVNPNTDSNQHSDHTADDSSSLNENNVPDENKDNNTSVYNIVTDPDRIITENALKVIQMGPTSGPDCNCWVPKYGGTKFHSNPDCSGMIDPIHTTKETAYKCDFFPCGKCYK